MSFFKNKRQEIMLVILRVNWKRQITITIILSLILQDCKNYCYGNSLVVICILILLKCKNFVKFFFKKFIKFLEGLALVFQFQYVELLWKRARCSLAIIRSPIPSIWHFVLLQFYNYLPIYIFLFFYF